MRAATALVGAATAMAAVMLPATPVEGQAPWHLVRSETLTVVGDQPPGRLRDIALRLETFRLTVGQLISNASRPPALPTIVLVVGPRRAMQPYLPPAMASSSAVAGYFRQDPDVNRIVMSLEGFTQSGAVAYHEYTHLLLRGTLTSPPLWLEEGIAEYYSSYSVAPGGREAIVGRPGREYGNLLSTPWMPVSDLITYGGGAAVLAHDDTTATAFYGEASMLVHYLMTRQPNGDAAINKYLTLLAEDQRPADAFLASFDATPESMDDTLRAYVAQGSFQPRRATAPATVRQTAAPIVLSAAETKAWQGEIKRSVGWPEGSADVEAAAVSQPGSPMVQLLLGRSRMADGDVDEGQRLLTNAADGAPADFLAQFWKGFWFVRARAAAGGLDSAAGAADAVRALRRAVAIRPSSSDAHALLTDALIAAGEPLGEAQAAIERAIDLAPQRLELNLKQAEVLLRLGQRDAAVGILTALADMKSDRPLAERAAAILAALR